MEIYTNKKWNQFESDKLNNKIFTANFFHLNLTIFMKNQIIKRTLYYLQPLLLQAIG